HIEKPTECTISIPAPEWLSAVLTEALDKVFRSRKTYALDGTDLIGWHPWIVFFEEAAFVERTLRKAAKDAGLHEDKIELTRLYKLAASNMLFLLSLDGNLAYCPWPLPTHNGWRFEVYAKGMTVEETQESLRDAVGEEKLQGVEVTRGVNYPI